MKYKTECFIVKYALKVGYFATSSADDLWMYVILKTVWMISAMLYSLFQGYNISILNCNYFYQLLIILSMNDVINPMINFSISEVNLVEWL